MMEAVDPHVEDAVLWLAQTILGVLFAGEMEAWIRRVGVADDTEKLKSEIERVEAVVTAVKGRAAENRPLARSLGRLKELLYNADDMVDELDYYRLQHQVAGGTIAWADQPPGTDVNGEAQLVDGSRDNSGMPNRKKRSKAWNEFSITEEDADGKPLKAECVYCGTVVRCETTKGTSVLHNHLKSENCKRKRSAIEQMPNPSSTDDVAQNGATFSTIDSDRRKRMTSDEVLAHDTAAKTYLWNKAEFCNKIQQTTHQLQKAISEVHKLYGSGSIASSNLIDNTAADPCRRTSSLVQRKMFGRIDEKNSIIGHMTGDNPNGVIVLPIIGIGGIGKTALGQFIYNDPIVKGQFNHRMWIWVSSNFDEVRLTMEMLDYVSQEKCVETSNLAKLQEILVTHITSKRTLLVLDDVWDIIDDSRWNKLLAPLRSDNQNSNVIIVTTRKLSTAKRIGTVEPIKLGRLHTDDFWLLFKKCALGDENYKEHLSLNIIGQQIAEKLQGNPLAAETVGMLLREYLTIDHWSNILKSEKWKTLEINGGIMNALKLSYDELPYCVQQCLLYCSIFPNNHQFLSKELVCNWISQGFVKCDHSTVRLEETGRNHLTDLVDSGFFEQVETQDTTLGDQTCYVISGLVHDFVRQVSRNFCTAINGAEYTKMLPSTRHLSIVTDATYQKDQRGNILPNVKFEETMQSIITHVAKLRTLVLIGEHDSLFFQIFKNVLQKAHCLRLLQISAANADHTSLCDLVSPTHLRYLKFENNVGDGALSQSLSKFYHLQVLDVGRSRCPDMRYSFNCLVSLRHLNMPKGVYSSIAGIGKMTSLQELHEFSAESSSSSKITELQFLDELLELGVFQLGNIGTRDEAYGAKMRDKQHLEKLHFSWSLPQDEYAHDEWSESEDEILSAESEDESLPVSNCNFTDTARDVLEGLEPHGNLKHLWVSGYSSAISPAWLGTSVTCLQTLHLEDCGKLKILPPLERLSFLTKLVLRNMQSVIEVSIPSLQELVLIKMPKLERCFCNSVSELNSRLTVLEMNSCRVLKAFPLFESCKKLKLEHKSWLPCLNELTLYKCPCLKVLNPLPPSSKVCKLDIARVSTFPTMSYRSSNGELIIGDTEYEEEDCVDVYSCELIKLDDKNFSFHNLRDLTRLHIARCQNLSYISLECVRQLISLKSLEIQNCGNLFSSDVVPEHAREDMGDANFNALPSLKALKIESCGITGKWLYVMLLHAPVLEEFYFTHCQNISSISLECFRHLISLNSLGICYCKNLFSSDVVPEHAREDMTDENFHALPSLEYLKIESCGITGKWLSVILRHAPALEELRLNEINQISGLLIEGRESSSSNHTSAPRAPSAGNPDAALTSSTPEGLLRIPSNSVSSLKKMSILLCEELTFQGNKEGFSVFSSLEELTVIGCPKLIPSLVQKYDNNEQQNGRWLLPHSLVKLEIEYSPETLQPCFLEDRNCLRKLVVEYSSSLKFLQLRSCTALEELVVHDCQSLAALEGNFSCLRAGLASNVPGGIRAPIRGSAPDLCTSGALPGGAAAGLRAPKPALEELLLRGNAGLESLQLYSCTALEKLTVEYCGPLIALEGNFNCLRELKLRANPMLKTLQLRCCTAREDLRIQNCESLDALEDFRSLRGLRYLYIDSCPDITTYVEHLLSRGYELCAGLERLCTDNYSFFTASFCKCLASLQYLKLHGRQVTRLTDEQERALQLLTSLQELRFERCNNLTDLPVGLHTLSSLKRLEIIYCSSISRLPEKGLPPSLEELKINYGCSNELIDECRMLAATRSKPRVKIDDGYVN